MIIKTIRTYISGESVEKNTPAIITAIFRSMIIVSQ